MRERRRAVRCEAVRYVLIPLAIAVNDYVRTTLRGAENSDMQGAYYGPAAPWSDGFAVRRLTRCA